MVVVCLVSFPFVHGYSSLAGSCEHAGVVHGMDRIEAQEGNGGYILQLGSPGVNVGGATVPVVLSHDHDEVHKGFLVYAVDVVKTESTKKEFHLGSWDAALMPDGAQQHPHCTHAATHDAFHNTGLKRDILPWIVPVDLTQGSEVQFKVTVVKDYETWFAFTQSFIVGSNEGGGVTGFTFNEHETLTGAPGSKAAKRAPGLGKAVEGGWQAPKTTETHAPGEDTSDEAKTDRKLNSAPGSTKKPNKNDLQQRRKASLGANKAKVQEGTNTKGGRKANAGAHTRDDKSSPSETKKTVAADPLAVDSAAAIKQRRKNARLAHGFAMTVAWLFFAPVGSLVARHEKSAKTWFIIHRASGMLITLITLISAWYITYVRGFSTPWGKHGKTGFVVCVLVLLQAVGGTYRKKFPRTKWAKWHRVVGVVAVILGAYNCLAGASMVGWMEVEYAHLLSYARVLVIGWIVIASILEVKRRRTGVARKRGRTA